MWLPSRGDEMFATIPPVRGSAHVAASSAAVLLAGSQRTSSPMLCSASTTTVCAAARARDGHVRAAADGVHRSGRAHHVVVAEDGPAVRQRVRAARERRCDRIERGAAERGSAEHVVECVPRALHQALLLEVARVSLGVARRGAGLAWKHATASMTSAKTISREPTRETTERTRDGRSGDRCRGASERHVAAVLRR